MSLRRLLVRRSLFQMRFFRPSRRRAGPGSAGARGYDLVICGHITLLPFAFLHRLWFKTPIALIIHGIEAWHPPQRSFVKVLGKRVDRFVAVSELTKARFLA